MQSESIAIDPTISVDPVYHCQQLPGPMSNFQTVGKLHVLLAMACEARLSLTAWFVDGELAQVG